MSRVSVENIIILKQDADIETDISNIINKLENIRNGLNYNNLIALLNEEDNNEDETITEGIEELELKQNNIQSMLKQLKRQRKELTKLIAKVKSIDVVLKEEISSRKN